MARDKLEIARGYFAALSRTLDGYAREGGPLEDAPFIDEFFEWTDPEIEWDWLFSPDTFVGREELIRGAADWLSAVEEWRVEVEDLIDAGDNVIGVLRIHALGRGSGAPVEQTIFTVLGFRNGRVARIKDHVDRAAAFETAGLTAD